MSKNKGVAFFDYQKQLKAIKPLIDKAIERVLNSGQLILGNEVKKFEQAFAKFLGVSCAIGVNSGTDALKIALKSAGVKPGDEIITVANTAVATISSLRELRALPKFVDIKGDFTIDETMIASAITKKTKAIIPVHLYGQACNMPAIMRIAKKYRLLVIEDCAQAHGAKINGQNVGTFGDLACFSFYPTKNLGAFGDGGLIATNNPRMAKICRLLRFYGCLRRNFAIIEGYNSRLDELQAAILNVKLKFLKKWNQRRRQIAAYYLDKIKNPKIQLPPVRQLNEHVFHLFTVKTPKRPKLIKYLAKNKISYVLNYAEPLHLQPAYKFLKSKKGALPKTELACSQLVCLPIWPELTKNEISYIVSKLNQFK